MNYSDTDVANIFQNVLLNSFRQVAVNCRSGEISINCSLALVEAKLALNANSIEIINIKVNDFAETSKQAALCAMLLGDIAKVAEKLRIPRLDFTVKGDGAEILPKYGIFPTASAWKELGNIVSKHLEKRFSYDDAALKKIFKSPDSTAARVIAYSVHSNLLRLEEWQGVYDPKNQVAKQLFSFHTNIGKESAKILAQLQDEYIAQAKETGYW